MSGGQVNTPAQPLAIECCGWRSVACRRPRRRRASTTTRARIVERLEKLFEIKEGSAKVVMAIAPRHAPAMI